MEEKTYRYTKLGMLRAWIFILPVIYPMAKLFFDLAPRDLFLELSAGEYLSFFEAGISLFFIGLMLLLIWFTIGIVLFSLKYRITLSETSLQIRSFDFWGRKLLNRINGSYSIGLLPYNEIMFVDVDSPMSGTARIICKDGRRILLSVRALENYQDFVEQLAGRLNYLQVEQGFLRLGKPKRFNRLLTVINVASWTIIIFMYFALFLDDWVPTIWNEEFAPWFVTNVSKDSDNSLWVGMSGNNDNLYIWHISENSRKNWIFSKDLCQNCRVNAVSHDSQGFPRILVDRDSSATYAWDGKKWARDDSGFDLETQQFPQQLSTIDSRIWGTHHDTLAYVDFGTDEKQDIPSPSEVESQNLRLIGFRVNPNKSLLAWFSEDDMPTLLYRFENGNWQKIAEFSLSDWRNWTYCQDFHGKVWVLRQDEDKHLTQVGFLDEGSEVWNWADFKLEHPAHFSNMDVDFYGRIWISGTYEPDDNYYSLSFLKALSWTENNTIEPIVEYTEKNSNLGDADLFVMTKDRIWISSFGDLYWANSDKVPSLLPEWVNWLRNNDWFGWYALSMIVVLVPLAIINMLLERNS